MFKVTVLMSVYNGEKYLKKAVDSILNQTFEDFEFIIIDDGSTDCSLEILKSYKDHRICLVKNEKNIGLTKSLNKGLKFSQGKYIARMDADDISFPDRLKKQVAFMDANPEIGVCGTWLKTYGKVKKTVWKSPIEHKDICARIFIENPIWHPTVIIRKETLIKNNLTYDENFFQAQDYKLWFEMMNVSKLANIPEVLLLYYINEDRISVEYEDRQKDYSFMVNKKITENFLGRPLTAYENKIHNSLITREIHVAINLEDVENWVDFLKNLNASKKTYVEPIFSYTLDKVKKEMHKKSFYYSTRYNKRYHPFLLFKLFLSKQKYFSYFPVIELLKVCIKCFILWPNKNFNHKKNLLLKQKLNATRDKTKI